MYLHIYEDTFKQRYLEMIADLLSSSQYPSPFQFGYLQQLGDDGQTPHVSKSGKMYNVIFHLIIFFFCSRVDSLLQFMKVKYDS